MLKASLQYKLYVMTVDLCSWCYVQLSWFVSSVFLCLTSMSLYHVLLCLLCFDFPCPHVSFKFSCAFSYVLPSVSLCLLVLFPPRFLLCAFSLLVTTPGLLSPLTPHLFLVLSLVSVYLVCVFPALLVRLLPLVHVCLCSCSCLFQVPLCLPL